MVAVGKEVAAGSTGAAAAFAAAGLAAGSDIFPLSV